MAIRIRKVEGYTIAICAAMSEPKEGDVYLDDDIHHALTSKFGVDFHSMGFCKEDYADDLLLPLMKKEQGGKLTH